jgi:N-acetylglutamate synthase-like GNAT family acetyltransferase
MTPSNYRVRRATLDDLGQLTSLWQAMHYNVDDLARRITEFQVADSGDGKVLGALGLQIAQRQGLVHSEGFTDFGLSERLRALMWDRLQALAINHGLHRLWTREEAPFWARCGLQKPDQAALAKLPAAWQGAGSGLLTIKLKEDVEEIISADKEFAMFMESEKQRSARALQQARVLKGVATVLALGLLGLVIAGAVLVISKNPHLLRH